MAYQNIPRFTPSYGNRYGFRQRTSAPSTGPANVPVPDSPSAPPPSPTTTGGSTRPSQDYHSGPSAESDGNQGIDAGQVRTEAAQSMGHIAGRQTPGQIAAGLLGFVPGGGLVGGYAADALDKATNFGGIPEHERYGAAGTYDVGSGGVFGEHGQAFDPITGRGLGVYRDRDAFLSSPYVEGIRANPYSPQSYLSDPINAYNYNRTNTGAGLQAQGFQFGLNRGAFAADEELGTLPTEEERARLAQHVGQTEYGFEEHTVAPDTATNEAIQGRGYTGSGAAPAGSQFSSTGTFSTQHSDSGDDSFSGPGGNPNTVSDEVTDDLADEDFGSYDDGGGGGGGK